MYLWICSRICRICLIIPLICSMCITYVFQYLSNQFNAYLPACTYLPCLFSDQSNFLVVNVSFYFSFWYCLQKKSFLAGKINSTSSFSLDNTFKLSAISRPWNKFLNEFSSYIPMRDLLLFTDFVQKILNHHFILSHSWNLTLSGRVTVQSIRMTNVRFTTSQSTTSRRSNFVCTQND
jgi:hypothetical protein